MADKIALKYWLESINLFQYYNNFCEHGIVTKEQCQTLTDTQLSSIGISSQSHCTRILTHLPSDEFWMDETSPTSPPPSLPQKTKNVRNSFLYQDNIDVRLNEGDRSPGETPKPAPRPVPRPRKTVQRPKPVPRQRPKPDQSHVNDSANSSRIDINTSPETKHSGNNVLSVNIGGACLEETSTDSVIGNIQEEAESNIVLSAESGGANVSSSKTEGANVSSSETESANVSSSETESAVVPISETKGGLGLNSTDGDLNRKAYEHSGLDDGKYEPGKNRHKSGEYCNVDLNNKLIAENQPTDQPCVIDILGNRDTTFENVEFDPTLNEFKVKTELAPDFNPEPGDGAVKNVINTDNISLAFQDDTVTADACRPQTPVDRKLSENVDEDDANVDDECLYEAIWVDPRKKNVDSDKQQNTNSPPMHFNYTKEETDTNKSHQSFRLSQLIGSNNRISSSFDMPPPSFPPPPLPGHQLDELINDFDPLSGEVEKKLPPIPHRSVPTTKQMSFEVYENVHSPFHTQSATLPSDQNMEPDILSPDILGNHNQTRLPISNDPFQYVDPFAEVNLDPYEDWSAEPQPVLCGNENSESSTFGTVLSFSPTAKQSPSSDAIYQVAVDTDNDFDPFGLKSTGSQLPRSASNTSSGSGHRLDMVPPAPSWYEQVADRSSLYSVAREEGDSDSNGSLDDLIDRDAEDDPDVGTMSPVELLPTTAMSARRRERSGYLFKQGGVKQNRGWRRRWVIFDGKTIRYYSSSKDQVSKRIVPLSCMLNVEMDVKPNNSKQFKFKLHCTNRVFLFATDNLDDCKMWSSTLMEAILTYKKPEGGEVHGGDMADPDMAEWIKIDKNRYKFYVVLKKHKFCYYQNKEDYDMASPLHEIDMKLASVKELERTKLQLSTHYCTFILHFESSSDASNWKMAIEESITDALGDNSVLDQVKENTDNLKCADCGAADANWASMNLVIVLCLKCAGIHRGFDHRLSKVRSLRMDTKVWNSSLIEMFKVIGNVNSNKFWIARLPPGCSLKPDESPEKRKVFLHKKYKEKLYCDKHPSAGTTQHLNEALLDAAQTDNVLLTMQILLSGADVLYTRPNDPNSTAFELAKEAHQRIQMEFLLQNGGDSQKEVPSDKVFKKTQNFMPGSEEASLVASLRAPIQYQGILQKTGPNMKDFLKRWCVLEHGHLSYFLNEESKVEKDRIDNDTILCIKSTNNDKLHPYCFDISSRRNNRLYMFSAATYQEQQQWMTKLSQVFCPVNLIESVKTKVIEIAGYAYMKTGFNSNWQRSWYVLENRKLYFTDKEQEERLEDSLDLRKVKSITKVTESISSCEACLEQGHLFALSAGDRTLYFQSDLVKDTDRMFTVFETAVKRGGDVLEDQVLQPDDCPVFVNTCVNYIEHHGLKMKGIYREAAQDSRVQALLDEFKEDARAVVLRPETNTIHEVCNALKRYLRRLKDPLLTSHLYKRWLQTATDCDHNSRLQWYKYLLQQLPRINYRTLKCLACHLYKLSRHSDQNFMTLDNISIAFGSTLMQAEKVDGGVTNAGMVGTQMQLEMKVITDIVTYCEWLFDVQESDENKDLEDKLKEAEERLKMITSRGSIAQNDMMIFVAYLDPKGSTESVKVNKNTKVSDVLLTLISKMKLNNRKWCLHEVVVERLERPLHPDEELWPLIHEWRNWSAEYSANVCLCLRSNDLKDKLQMAFDPGRALFAEMKYADKKKSFAKTAFEFTQAKLSYYKDLKNLGNPVCSWNIEDLCIYKGHDPKRSPPSGSKWHFTFLSKGDRVGSKELPYFGRTVCCPSEQDLLLWISAMLKSQHSSWFS